MKNDDDDDGFEYYDEEDDGQGVRKTEVVPSEDHQNVSNDATLPDTVNDMQ